MTEGKGERWDGLSVDKLLREALNAQIVDFGCWGNLNNLSR